MLFVGNEIPTYNLFHRKEVNYLEAFHGGKSSLYLQAIYLEGAKRLLSELIKNLEPFFPIFGVFSTGRAPVWIPWP